MRRTEDGGTFQLRDDTSAKCSGQPSSSVRHAQAVLQLLFGPPDKRTFAVQLWDGTTETPSDVPAFTLELRNPEGLRRMLLPPSELKLGQAYVRNDVDVHGDLEAAVGLGDVFEDRVYSASTALRLLPHLLALPRRAPRRSAPIRSPEPLGALGQPHDELRDGAAIRFHYDVGNDFYGLWLDNRMVYSCAYFPTGTETLDDAQKAKLDLICRKLCLSAGGRLLDIGCGWGALVQNAAQQYSVDAIGITLSEGQAAFARSAIAEAGLGGRARVELRDYRHLDEPRGFDWIASVGMVEHVGRAQLKGYFAKMFQLLRPDGLFLNHGIVALDDARPRSLVSRILDRLWMRSAFIYRYVFPDGEILQLAEMVRAAEAAGFETRHVESLRNHYTLTLRHWLRRLEMSHHEAAALVGESTYRVWRLYLAASARAFATGRLGVVQMLLVKSALDGGSPPPATSPR